MGSTSEIDFTLKTRDFLDTYNNAMQHYDVDDIKAIEDFIDTSTPIRKLKKTEDVVTVNPDQTPSKNLVTKRRSLMREMIAAETEMKQETAKHSMEMRSRKRTKEPYYHYQEYVDFAEDLIFLFDEQLPERRPRKHKSRKKRAMQETRKTPERNKQTNKAKNVIPTSKILQFDLKDATQTTSKNFSTNFETRPNMRDGEKICPITLDSDLTICNKNLTSDPTGTCPKNISAKGNSKSRKRKNLFPDYEKKTDKRQKMHLSVERSNMHLSMSDVNKRFRTRCDTKTLRLKEAKQKCANEKTYVRDEQKYNNNMTCVVHKLDSYSHFRSSTSSKNQMTLRRNSTSTLFHQKSSKKLLIRRTVSSPCEATLEMRKKFQPKVTDSPMSSESPKLDEGDSCEYSEEFVDSPDSGFGSESSCSASSPSGELLSGFFEVASRSVNEDSAYPPEGGSEKGPISRTNSSDSGVGVGVSSSPSSDTRSLLFGVGDDDHGFSFLQDSIKKNLKLEQEEKKRKEEEALRDRFQCHWLNCKSPFKSRSVADLHKHLNKCHVQKMKAERYCCRWQGCKMFEKFSRKLSWLERHVGEHSGENPFKCILSGCDASFKTLPCLKRHVDAHYTEVSLPKARVGGEQGPLSRFMLNSRRIQDKRKTLANRLDCMDNCTLGYIKGALIREEVAMATKLLGQSDAVFTPQVVARKNEKDGTKSVLVKWHPADMLPDQWVPEYKLEPEKKMRKSLLPTRAKEKIKELFFQNQNRRKPGIVSNQTLFRGMFDGK